MNVMKRKSKREREREKQRESHGVFVCIHLWMCIK